MTSKASIRERMVARRNLVSRVLCEKLALQQRDHAINGLQFRGVIGAYRPTKREADPWPLLIDLHERKLTIALPCLGEHHSLIFRRWEPGDTLSTNRLGIEEPLPEAPELTPDMFILPLIAFDMKGHRLGYGGGYYDRLLAQPSYSSSRRIGYGYDFQKVECLPSEPYDVTLDYVVTETALYRFLE